MASRNAFKEAIANGSKPIGTFQMIASAQASEIMALVGFDFLMVDLEHSPFSLPQLHDCLRAIETTTTQALVRLQSDDPIHIKQVLDAGAKNLMVPMVQTADQARKIVQAAKYPPEGQRGFALFHRGSRYGTDPDFLAAANNDTCLIAQIETLAAKAELEAIAAVDGIDGLFAGPGDLSADLGVMGNTNHESVIQALMEIGERCARNRIPLGTVLGDAPSLGACLSNGYTFGAIGNDIRFLMGQAKTALSNVKELTQS